MHNRIPFAPLSIRFDPLHSKLAYDRLRIHSGIRKQPVWMRLDEMKEFMMTQVTTVQALKAVLTHFQASTPGIQGAVLIDCDGFIIEANLPAHVDDITIASIGATLVALSEQLSAQLHHGLLKRTFIESEAGLMSAVRVGESAVLVAIAHHDIKPGLLFLHLQHTAHDLGMIMTPLTGRGGNGRSSQTA